MIKDAIANSPNRLRLKLSSGLTCDRDPESIIHCILKFLFAPDVALSCLDRSVAKQKLNLFQFASTTMAEPSASATKIVGGQMVYAGPPAHRFTAYQTTLAVTQASWRSPFFKTRLNTLPSLTFE